MIDENATPCTTPEPDTTDDQAMPPLSTLAKYHSLADDLHEIQQIEYQQSLIADEINRIDAQKQRLQELLLSLRSIPTTRKKKSTTSTTSGHRKRLQSNSRLD